jgi:hypothetical protein
MCRNECVKMEKDEKHDEKKECDIRKYVSMTDQEIKTLAEDIYKGMVFTDRHVDRQEDISSIFMPLMLMGKDLIDGLQKNPPGMIYEYMERAEPRTINGMPIFMSFKMVSVGDTKKVFDHYHKIKEAVTNA